MIIIEEHRRLWEVNHTVVPSGNTIKITVDEFQETFDLAGIEDGSYVLEDSQFLPYNPISSITKTGDNILVKTFYDDPYTRGVPCPFKKEASLISPVQTADNNLDMAKEAKYKELSTSYSLEFVTGHFYSEALGIDIDNRRSSDPVTKADKNDLQNIDVLIEVMTDTGTTNTDFKGYQDQVAVNVSLEQIKAMRKEMLLFNTTLYGKKEMLEGQVASALTIEDVKIIKW